MTAEFTSFLLMGGKSRRMGQNKAELLYDGLPFWRRIASALAPNVYISADKGGFPLPVVKDERPNCGALGAMISCLRQCPTELAFFCACDMPLVTRALPEFLANCIPPDAQAAIPQARDGRLYPLCGLYRREILPLMEAQLQRGELRIMRLLSLCRITILLPPNHWQLRNINTPEEYRQLLAEPPTRKDADRP